MNDAVPQAFAHRDDENARPLLDALEVGVRHIEFDMWYLFGQLLVAHDPQDLRPGRTVTRLYLDPLVEAYETGRLAPTDATWLYVDVKTRAMPAYRAVERLAERYGPWIARPGKPSDGAPIRLVLTGNRPPYATLDEAESGWCHFDGRLPHLAKPRNRDTMPIVSDDWGKFTRWRGAGPIPEQDLQKLQDAVAAAHSEGQLLRFWATPEKPGPERTTVWTTLLDEGVDLINTDDLVGLTSFLRERQADAPTSSSSSA